VLFAGGALASFIALFTTFPALVRHPRVARDSGRHGECAWWVIRSAAAGVGAAQRAPFRKCRI
jgi:hypothetical protein